MLHGQVPTQSKCTHRLSDGPFASAARDRYARALGGCTFHRCSCLSHCPPFVPHSISRPFLIKTLQMRVLSPLPTPFKFRGTQSFPLTPSSHGCEGVNGKRRGAPSAAQKWGWARAQGWMKIDDGCSKPPAYPTSNRTGNAPDPGAYSWAYWRSNWRAISGRPAIDCGSAFQPSRA